MLQAEDVHTPAKARMTLQKPFQCIAFPLADNAVLLGHFHLNHSFGSLHPKQLARKNLWFDKVIPFAH